MCKEAAEVGKHKEEFMNSEKNSFAKEKTHEKW